MFIGWSINFWTAKRGARGQAMTEPRLLMPQLYDGGSPPALQGGVCDCGHVFFPLQAYGC